MELHAATLQRLQNHWTELKGDRAYPERRDFDPIQIPNVLPFIALTKTAITLEGFEFRVWGTGLADRFGEDRSNKKFGDLRHIENWQQVFQDYKRAADTGQQILFRGRMVSSDRKYLRYDRLLLPFGNTGTGITHVLAGFAFYENTK